MRIISKISALLRRPEVATAPTPSSDDLFDAIMRRTEGLAERLEEIAAAIPAAVLELPDPEVIENAMTLDDEGRKDTNAGSRKRRAAKKVLDLLPVGLYGSRFLWREETAETVDLDAVRRRYAALGEDIPLKTGISVKHRAATADELAVVAA